MPRKSKKSRPRGLRRRAFRVVVWATGLIAAFYLSCTVSLILLRTLNPVLTGVQVQRRIEAVLSGVTTYEKRQTFVHLEQVPLHVRRAVIAAEDGSFYQHGGVDWGELIIVFREYRGSGRLRGASTISQCAGSARTGERTLRVSVDAALRAGIFKASGSFDPMGWSVGARRSFPRP